MKSFIVSTQHIVQFRKRLLLWYREYGRKLPWRETHDPYKILVSEIMLQQTQVDRVKEKYRMWLKKFPTVKDLAKANRADVLAMWSGLGYNRRALALHQTAKIIVEQHKGIFPKTIEELQALPGIGKYTASAVVSFAFRKPVPIVDTNVKRVLGRVFLGYKTLAQYLHTDEPFWVLKQKVVPKSTNAYDFNQGIMDFGAIICTARQPKCEICPLQKICNSYPEIQQADMELLRVKKKRTEPQYFGYPRRIWRGKILQFLHTQPNNQADIISIGKNLLSDWDTTPLSWLQEVILTLEKDGLVKIKRKTIWIVYIPQ